MPDVTAPRRPRRFPVGGRSRTGIMGGSFNPPHTGHLEVAQAAFRRMRLDTVIWLVTPGNPLKDPKDYAPLGERVAAAQKLAARRAWLMVSDAEARFNTAFTAQTLEILRSRSRRERFVWIMGADGLMGFHHWHRWQQIAATVPICVVTRPGSEYPALRAKAARTFGRFRVPEGRAVTLPDARPPAWTLLTGHANPLQSRDLRACGAN